ncbi:MAG: SH3 domain-containing protein [Lachnospiraceae bacterium]|nr:SH3 domain-containing protein [Lachnospiraceae bacterium]
MASQAFVFPAAGGALAAGIGCSIQDIRANVARNAAMKSTIATHDKITKKDDETVEKVETPSSKAVNEGTTIDGVAVVGSASEGATIEITSDDNPTGKGGMNGGDDTELETEDVKTEEPANPSIDVKPEAQDVEEGEEDLSDQVIAVVDGYVNVRSMPDENSEIVGKLYNHSAGTWLDKQGDWYKISSGNVVGFVKGEYVKTGLAAVKLAAEVGQRTATVHTTTLKIREEASLDSKVLGLVANEDQLTVIEETEEWVKVNIEEGDGWVSKEYVSIATLFPQAESKAEEEARLKREAAERKKAQQAAARSAGGKKSGKSGGGGGSYAVSGGGLGASVANYALQFVGNPYVYGGTSLTNGTDCSGFTMGVYRNFGVSLPHSSGAQRSMGYAVGSLAEAQPGDLVCYSGHVGLYIGGGQIVHASTAATGIKVSNAGYRNILAIRRIF